jgi:hypothetical protein
VVVVDTLVVSVSVRRTVVVADTVIVETVGGHVLTVVVSLAIRVELTVVVVVSVSSRTAETVTEMVPAVNVVSVVPADSVLTVVSVVSEMEAVVVSVGKVFVITLTADVMAVIILVRD